MPKKYIFSTNESLCFFAIEISGTLEVLKNLPRLCEHFGATKEGILTALIRYFGQSDIKDIIIPITIEKILKYYVMGQNSQKTFEIIGNGHDLLIYYKKLKPRIRKNIEERYIQELPKRINQSGISNQFYPNCQSVKRLIIHSKDMFAKKRYKHFTEYNNRIINPNNMKAEGFTNAAEHISLELLIEILYDLSGLDSIKNIYCRNNIAF